MREDVAAENEGARALRDGGGAGGEVGGSSPRREGEAGQVFCVGEGRGGEGTRC